MTLEDFDLTGVLGESGHAELDDPEVLKKIWNDLEKAEEDDFVRYDEYQARTMETLWTTYVG